MLEHVHQHILNELQQSARTDTICIVTAVVFNLVILGISWATADSSSRNKKKGGNDILLAVFIALTLLVNTLTTAVLYTGKSTRGKLLDGLFSMYQASDVGQYYEVTLLTNYDKRYFLFTGVILCLGFTAIVAPLVVRLTKKDEPEPAPVSYEPAEIPSGERVCVPSGLAERAFNTANARLGEGRRKDDYRGMPDELFSQHLSALTWQIVRDLAEGAEEANVEFKVEKSDDGS